MQSDQQAVVLLCLGLQGPKSQPDRSDVCASEGVLHDPSLAYVLHPVLPPIALGLPSPNFLHHICEGIGREGGMGRCCRHACTSNSYIQLNVAEHLKRTSSLADNLKMGMPITSRALQCERRS